MKISIYTVNEAPIGGGGMGNVYLGTDKQGSRVAIKRMHPQLTADAVMRDFFRREIDALLRLEHSSIVKIYAAFEENGVLYLVMEYVEGETVEHYVKRRGALPESDAAGIMCDILPALGYVHSQGFVHRDVKPNNIMIRPDGRTCLLDFGVIKDMKNSSGHTVSQIIGTDGYMSPEQANAMSIDSRSDIYSLGCVLFYMLVGQHAIQKQSSDHATRMSIIQSAFPRAKNYRPDISDNIQNILDRATSKDMRLRFQSCREFEMEIRSGETAVSSGQITVSVGKINCDITVPGHPKVSRHHLDIIFFNEDGISDYILSDRSTNGTVVKGEGYGSDGLLVHKSEIFLMRKYMQTTILLAGEVELKWADVEAAFARKHHTVKPPVTDKPPALNHTPPPVKVQGESASGWLIAIYVFAALGGLLGLAFGISVYRQKIILPDGRKTPKYMQSHRMAAMIGAILSGISMIIWRTLITV